VNVILYLIPARGGSKRLPGKNLRKLAGIPLVAWAIRRAQGAARLVGGESRIVVSTDSEEIAMVSREWGAEVLMRPAEISADESPVEQTALHAYYALGMEASSIVLVQPTSPLTDGVDLAGLIRRHNDEGAAWMLTTHDSDVPCGAGYVLTPAQLAHRGFAYAAALRAVGRWRAVDIDIWQDWDAAEALLAARPVAPFSIAGREIGPGHPCFVIAEAGINHGGDHAQALALVQAAADAGADAVKFQTFNADMLAEPGPHRDMLRRHVLSVDWYETLKYTAESLGLVFLTSVFDEASADFMDDYVPAFKIPSGEIINLPLLRHVASKGKPVILSTGMSTMREVAAAVDALAGVPLALLHCVSEYPAAPAVANLRAMETMRQAFGVPVGWSEHVNGGAVTLAALARGASIIEKHIMLDYRDIDAPVSLTPGQFESMVSEVREIESAFGSGEKVPTPGELETAKMARRRDGLRRNAS